MFQWLEVGRRWQLWGVGEAEVVPVVGSKEVAAMGGWGS